MSERSFSPVIPFLRYQDPTAAVDWLVNAFGLERFDVTEVDGKVVHAELSWGNATIQLGGGGPHDTLGMVSPRELPATSGGIYICVGDAADVDKHHERSVQAGAKLVYELHDTSYGSRDYGVYDLEGHVWSFGSYLPREASA
ncbi:VOC family protein [Micromonospora sp. NPDC047467]|uniref:VOC family protein n=1 Tax=Micromonospora sp. NPDC047467 TaxID=3154814 RepID=UPI0033E6ED47